MIWRAIDNGCLHQVRGGVTADELAGMDDGKGSTALHTSASVSLLNQIHGGVTASKLASTKDARGNSALRCAAAQGCLDQIQGQRVPELLNERDDSGCSTLALAILWGSFQQLRDLLPEHLTEEILLSRLGPWSFDGLDLSVIEHLLLCEVLPAGLSSPSWIKLAFEEGPSILESIAEPQHAARFISNVPPEYMVGYKNEARTIANRAANGEKVAAAKWLAQVFSVPVARCLR